MYLYHDELRAGDLTTTIGCGTWLLQVVNDGERKNMRQGDKNEETLRFELEY
jgi:hypothetical protein